MKSLKLLLALSLIGYSIGYPLAANAEITIDDQHNISFTGPKNAALSIAADGSVSVNGTVVHKCDGSENDKVTKTKTATVTCDSNYVTVRDHAGNELSRFSSYTMSTDSAHNTDRKLYDPAIAQIGSGTTGAAALNQTQSTTIETKKEVVQKKVTSYQVQEAKPANVSEKNYTPKLGTEAERTPSVTKYNTPADSASDRAEREAAKANAKINSASEAAKATPDEVIIDSNERPVETVEKTTTTTTAIPTPDAAAQGISPTTKTDTTTQVIAPADQIPSAGSSILQNPGVGN